MTAIFLSSYRQCWQYGPQNCRRPHGVSCCVQTPPHEPQNVATPTYRVTETSEELQWMTQSEDLGVLGLRGRRYKVNGEKLDGSHEEVESFPCHGLGSHTESAVLSGRPATGLSSDIVFIKRKPEQRITSCTCELRAILQPILQVNLSPMAPPASAGSVVMPFSCLGTYFHRLQGLD